jgi:hypothetical protein
LKEGAEISFITPNLRAYPFLISKFTPFWFHQLYGFLRARRDEDIFPTRYRLNTTAALRRHFGEAGFELVQLKQVDSSCDYFDIFPVLFLIAAVFSQLLNRLEALSILRQFHIGHFRKPAHLGREKLASIPPYEGICRGNTQMLTENTALEK